jgi:hypothetical protein
MPRKQTVARILPLCFVQPGERRTESGQGPVLPVKTAVSGSTLVAACVVSKRQEGHQTMLYAIDFMTAKKIFSCV